MASSLDSDVSRCVPLDGSGENRGGYPCDFVEPLSDVFQTECPICLQILKEPCVISCRCGKKICRECIEPLAKEKKPCPLCNKSDFTFMRDHGFERSLKELEVLCSSEKNGCGWRGKLGELELHLNRNPSPEKQLKGCQFVEIQCMYECGERFQRRYITGHETTQCKKRPYSCDYCRDYQSTFEDVTEIHYPQCSKYPVACPNECRVYMFERQELKSHLQDQCPLSLVDCPFHCAGCQTRLLCRDMPEHMKEAVTHLTLLASVTQNLVKENRELQQTTVELRQRQKAAEEEVQTLKEENWLLQQIIIVKEVESHNRTLQYVDKKDLQYRHKLKDIEKEVQTLDQQLQHRVTSRLQALEEENKDLILKHQATEEEVETLVEENEALRQKQQITEEDIQTLRQETLKLKLDLTQLSGFPVDFRCKQTNDEMYSPAFYTHPHGYRMCVAVHPNGSGERGRGTHVSLYVFMMQGPFDDDLKWPFRGEITLQIGTKPEITTTSRRPLPSVTIHQTNTLVE